MTSAISTRPPVATYRLQLGEKTTFEAATGLIPYLERLGIADLYLSPILAARPGSTHGYDVIDPTRLEPAFGSDDDLEALAQELKRRNMGLLVDIVPNHMSTSAHNPWWRDVLRHGPASAHAAVFDIDWDPEPHPELAGKVLLPLLGDSLDEVIERGELVVGDADDGPVVRYFEHELPLAPGTEHEPDLRSLLARQHWTLQHWDRGSQRVNWRRFFALHELIGVRVEDPAVLLSTHGFILRLVAEGTVTGLRVDHIDGLRDPEGYLDDLQRLVGAAPARRRFPVYVEKILERGERLPASWAVLGTTGYEFQEAVNDLFIDFDGYEQLVAFYEQLTGRSDDFHAVADAAKRHVLETHFVADFDRLSARLTRVAERVGSDVDPGKLRQALGEVTVGLGIYRTYTRDLDPRSQDRARVEMALLGAEQRGVDPEAVALLRRVFLLDPDASPEERAEWLDIVLDWQQLTGPVMAKGVEDTAFYSYVPLLSVNAVGSSPDSPRSDSLAHFHNENRERLERWPYALCTTATHDSKRGEDARVRLDVLTEIASDWAAAVEKWSTLVDPHRGDDHGDPAPDRNDELLLYQTLLAVWPLPGVEQPEPFPERIERYVVKAAREAKQHTSWHSPNATYEDAYVRFAHAVLADARFLEAFEPFQQRVAWHGMLNGLAQVLLRVASPGTPDLYQGNELWDLNLVDPDNRRPVDFEHRRRLLEELEERSRGGASGRAELLADLVAHWPDGRIKLWVLTRALRSRRDHPTLFSHGEYRRLHASGRHADKVVAFARRLGDEAALVVAPRFTTRLAPDGSLPVGPDVWGDTTIEFPIGTAPGWHCRLSGTTLTAEERVPVGELLTTFPCALLVQEP